MSYDEMAISALMALGGPVQFLNKFVLILAVMGSMLCFYPRGQCYGMVTD